MDKKETHINLKSLFFVLLDLADIAIASMMGLLLRFDFSIDNLRTLYPGYLDAIWEYLPLYALGTIIIFYLFKLYHTLWIYAGINELMNITIACIAATLLQIAGMELLFYEVPRSYYLLSGIVLYLLTLVNRFMTRLVFQVGKNIEYSDEASGLNQYNTNVMVIGGGEAANIIIKEIKNSSHIDNVVVKCVIDDSHDKVGKYIQGVKVVGNRDTILYNVKKYKIDEIYIAIPSASKRTIREIVKIGRASCRERV